ncbi:hypothetical protein ACP70R_023129 [Stipagrostis hirtigluma subsp. patula]
MARGPRRLRNLNFEVQEEHVHGDHAESDENEQDDEENLQGPPEIDNVLAGLPHQHAHPIKIIWPNGEVRQILGQFRTSELLKSHGGKIIVGTDENGVPNERSASILGQYLGDIAEKPTFAPLHIPRWDNRLFDTHKESIIKDVERKFVYPAETKQLTRDWILHTVNNRWRAYKSKLKQKYFNPDERPLDAILKDVPNGVNPHQWSALLGIWCGEKHKQLCLTNSRCANEQKNPHTTGRKSHARLKKEMEERKKSKVHKIELWDEAHKKKDGSYANNNVKTVMDTSYDELAKRKVNNNGTISAKDYDEVFDGIVAKESKPRGYYDNKYWSQIKVSEGLVFVDHSGNEMSYSEIKEMKNEMEHVNSKVSRMEALLARRFPEEDGADEIVAAKKNVVDQVESEDDNDIRNDSRDNDGHYYDDNIAESSANTPYSTNPLQMQPSRNHGYNRANKDYANSSSAQENMIAQLVHLKNDSQDKGYAGLALPRDYLTKLKQGSQNKKVVHHDQPKSALKEILLMSLRNKNKVLAKGNLVTTDRTGVVGGNMLGTEYYGVAVHAVSNLGDESLPRPYDKFSTVRDAIGYVIAWPKSHVKRPPPQAQKNA